MTLSSVIWIRSGQPQGPLTCEQDVLQVLVVSYASSCGICCLHLNLGLFEGASLQCVSYFGHKDLVQECFSHVQFLNVQRSCQQLHGIHSVLKQAKAPEDSSNNVGHKPVSRDHEELCMREYPDMGVTQIWCIIKGLLYIT